MGTKFYLFIFLLVISNLSIAGEAMVNFTEPFAALQKSIPYDLTLRPNLSLAENLKTIFAELELRARSSEALSGTVPPTWGDVQDQNLLETFLLNRELYLKEASQEIQAYFSQRMKKALLGNPQTLWRYYTKISDLFPDNPFWLTPYQLVLSKSLLPWSTLTPQKWNGKTLIPALLKKTPSSWNKEVLINILAYFEYQFLKPVFDQDSFLSQLHVLNDFVSVIEGQEFKSMVLSPSDIVDFEKRYLNFLFQLSLRLSSEPSALQQLVALPPFTSTSLETMAMGTLLLGRQRHLIPLLLTMPRIKRFQERHDQTVSWIHRSLSHFGEKRKIHRLLTTVFYLRTLISIKITLSDDREPLYRGRWVSPRQQQMSLEISWLDELAKAQTEAMRVTQLTLYNVSLVDTCYRDLLETPTCQNWRRAFPIKLIEQRTRHGQKTSLWSVSSSSIIELPAGDLQLAAGDSLVIEAPEVHFHPLTRIIIPSGRIEIKTQKLIAPWVDVSGVGAEKKTQANLGETGHEPWVKNSKLCTTRDYLDGVNLANIPHKTKIDWIGFSIKNPFPKNILICASSVRQVDRDLVGDLSALLDLGSPPQLSNLEAVPSGDNGGQIQIHLSNQKDNSLIPYPLFVAFGGNGHPGQNGYPSPLCVNKRYRPFKIGLSHHKIWFQRWLNLQKTHPQLSLLELKTYGDHWFGLFEINLPRSSGGDGSAAGSGGKIRITGMETIKTLLPKRWFLTAGIPGSAGLAGVCGPNKVTDGKPGRQGSFGQLQLR